MAEGSIHVRYPEDGLLIVTNHAVCPQFAGKETHVPESSRKRYNRLYKLMKDKLIDIEAVKKALSDHKDCVCTRGKFWAHHENNLVSGWCHG